MFDDDAVDHKGMGGAKKTLLWLWRGWWQNHPDLSMQSFWMNHPYLLCQEHLHSRNVDCSISMNDLYLWGIDGYPHLQDLATDEGLLHLGFHFDGEMTDELIPHPCHLWSSWRLADPRYKPKHIDSSFKKLSIIDHDSFVDWHTHLYQDLRR